RWLNQEQHSAASSMIFGAAATLIVLVVVFVTTIIAVRLTDAGPMGFVIQAVLASSLLASRSLYEHVAAVAVPMKLGKLAEARSAVAMIVGRDPKRLDEAGVCRASIESLAENSSDGVIAPLFWGLCCGLPGLATYKAINTLDSMIGHKSDRYLYFGRFAARLDDIANLLPARLSGLLLALASGGWTSLRVMWRDARKHRSPNAGWPEAAMAGALERRLSGPRAYLGGLSPEPWLNEGAPDPKAQDIVRALRLYVRALLLVTVVLAAVVLIVWKPLL
ncbi:MAG: adenosylcobinamide-phosphate synthase CbiB, partial [Pseudomonadota bacterium]